MRCTKFSRCLVVATSFKLDDCPCMPMDWAMLTTWTDGSQSLYAEVWTVLKFSFRARYSYRRSNRKKSVYRWHESHASDCTVPHDDLYWLVAKRYYFSRSRSNRRLSASFFALFRFARLSASQFASNLWSRYSSWQYLKGYWLNDEVGKEVLVAFFIPLSFGWQLLRMVPCLSR